MNKLLQNVKAVYFSKETVVLHWCVCGGGGGKGGGWVLQDDLMLSTELMMYIIAIIPVSKADVSSVSP